VASRHALAGEWVSAAAAYAAAAQHVGGVADAKARRLAGELLALQAHCFVMVHDLDGAAEAAAAALQADALRFDAAMHLGWTVLCAGEVDTGLVAIESARDDAVRHQATAAVRAGDAYRGAVRLLLQAVDEHRFVLGKS